MQLLLRVRPTDGTPRDLRIDVDAAAPVSALVIELAAFLGVTPSGSPSDDALPGLYREATGIRLDPHGTVGGSGLVSGESLVLGSRPNVRPSGLHPETPGGITLDVIAGPQAGHTRSLTPGRFVVGRDQAASVCLDDPTVSRRQFVIDVHRDSRVFITAEPGAVNETLVDGRQLGGTVELGSTSVVQAGASVLAVRHFVATRSEPQDRLGSIPFHRTPYRPSVITERAFEPLGDIPTRPEPRRFAVLGAVAPLIGGIALYAFSRQPQFLALTALTPLTMAASWFEERRSGGRRHVHDLARFHDALATRRAEVDAALDAERVERLRAAPDTAELARRAGLKTIDLWPRSPGGADFLDVRLGLGETPSLVRCPVGSQGDPDLRREATATLAGHDRLASVPIVVKLAELGTLAMQGDDPLACNVAAAVLLQAATLHSPEDLILLGALAPRSALADQMKWLPHTRSLSSPIAGPHVVTTPAAAQALCAQLIAVAQQRSVDGDGRVDRRWPWLLVVLDESLGLDAGVVARLLDTGGQAGMSVLWLTRSATWVPRQAQAVLRNLPSAGGPSELWFRDPGRALVSVELESLQPDVADRAMRALAPMRDAGSADATSAIPRVVPLFAALGVDDAHRAAGGAGGLARSIVERWVADVGYSLQAPLGLTAHGVMTLDLVTDGPHVLIGGTSGSGKSELLVALVAGLVARHSPARLNLLFVDYKGGAASSAFQGAPHTVGYVTNLTGDLASRALVSLRAELNRRMGLLAGRAKDLEEMQHKHPELAPPSLVIVVDEFATLVKEVPDFVPGIVDIAQRGRSLGIHLILATQRPSGAVNENILANTNARLCLRMIDAAESSSIIGSPEAAAIPVPLRGRGLARLGPGELTAFQTAYGPTPIDTGEALRIRVEDFSAGGRDVAQVAASVAVDRAGGTQLDALLGAIDRAAESLHLPVPRAPWLDELPEVVPLDVVLRGFTQARGRWRLPIGEFDDPQHQLQDTVTVDLEEGGGLLVFGAAGSGKTTLLRTLAAAASAVPPPEGVAIFGLDFASRALRAVEALEACSVVAPANDLEAVTRVLALLELEVGRRRAELGGAESLSAHLAAGAAPLPRVLVLVDGYSAMRDLLTGDGASSAMHGWMDRFHRLVSEGRQVGVHTVITADRGGAVPPVLLAAIARRLILRQVDERGLVELGVPGPRARGLDLRPGRGLLDGNLLVQVACHTDGATDGAAQAAALARSARRAGDRPPPELLTAALGESEGLPAVPGIRGLVATIGLADVTRAPVTIDLEEGSLVVAGPSRSGRSSVLAAMLSSLSSAGAEVYVVGPPSSPLRHLDLWCPSAFGDVSVLGGELVQMATAYPDIARVLVVDDADRLLEDAAACAALDPLARCDAVHVVAAVETGSLASGYFQSALMQQIRKFRRRLLLQPSDDGEIQVVLGVRYPLRPGLSMPPGRGVLLVAGRPPVVVQVGEPLAAGPAAAGNRATGRANGSAPGTRA